MHIFGGIMRKGFLKALLMVLLLASLFIITSCDLIMGEQPADDITTDDTHTHSYGAWREVSAPTCTTAGKQERRCLICSESETSDIPAKGHTRGDAVKENVIAGTCQSEGSYDTVVYCKSCNSEMSRETYKTAFASHTSDGGTATVTKQPNCTEQGVRTVVESCTVCHNKLREITETIPALGHSNTKTEEQVLSSPTCSETGVKRITVICGVCDATVSETDVSIPTVDHAPSEVHRSVTLEPTCTSSGTYVDLVSCTVCGTKISATPGSLPKLGHDLSEWQTEVTKEPTCTATGRAESYNLCSRCGTKVNKKTTTLGVIDHKAGEATKEELASTCAFYWVWSCTMCSTEMEREYVNDDAIIHTPGEAVITVTKKATCTSAGKVREDISCTKCGTLISRTERDTEKAPHTEGTTTTSTIRAATCQTPGLKRDTTRCSVCKEIISKVEYEIPTVDHSYGSTLSYIVLEATCTAEGNGYDYQECIWCKNTIVIEEYTLNAYGHNTTKKRENQVSPTCTEPGGYDMVESCKRCGDVISSTHYQTAAKGHTKAEAVTENDIAPTCTLRGSYDTVNYCTVCSDEVSRITTYIDALGHTPADSSVIENYVLPTCARVGTYDEVVYCTVCNEDVTRVEKTIEKLPHTYDFITCTGCGAEAECNDGINLTLNDEGTGYILNYCSSCSHDVVYVTTHKGLPIVEISTYAFRECKATHIIIGKSVENIDDYALASASIQKIEVEDKNRSFKLIGESLFTLDETTLVRFISTEKANIVIDAISPIFKLGAFTYSDDVASVTVNGGISYIDSNMFRACTSLESVVINTTLEEIDSYAFYGCTVLSEVSFNATVGHIDSYAFNGCASLTAVVIPDGIIGIGTGAFENCSSLDYVKLGEGLTSISDSTFEKCGTIEKVVIPSTVTKIGVTSFSGTVVDHVCFNGDEDAWEQIDGINFSNALKNATVYCYLASKPLMPGDYWRYVDGVPTEWPPIPEGEGTKGLEYQINDDLLTYTVVGFGKVTDEHIVIPSTYNDMPVVAFIPRSHSYNYKSLVIPDSVTEIGESAFYSWEYLESVTLSKNLTYIPAEAFKECLRLYSIVIPEGVTEIHDSAFLYCSSLVSVSLPSTLLKIEDDAFIKCDNICEIYNFSRLDIKIGSTDNGCVGKYARHIYTSSSSESGLFNADGICYYSDGEICVLLKYTEDGDTLTLPEHIGGMDYSVTRYAIESSTAKHLYISSAVISLEDLRISTLTMLEYIEVAEDNPVYTSRDGILYTKDMSTLLYCPVKYQSVSVVVPNGVSVIGVYAFKNARGIESVTLPDSVTTIMMDAFAYCLNLKEIHLGSGLQEISAYVFKNCTALTTVVLPDTLESIDTGAFEDSGITDIIIPKSVSYMGGHIFRGCQNLTVRCEAEEDLDDWYPNWYNGADTVIYGYVKES